MTLQLEGECNRCGMCCTVDGFTCQYLMRSGELGQPEATVCQVYDQRHHGMPILMWKGLQMMVGHCAKGTDEETQAIMDRGIGHGCSLIHIGERP